MAIVVARIRVPTFVIGMLLVLASPLHHLAWVSWLGAVLILASIATTFMPGGTGQARADSGTQSGARPLDRGQQPGRQGAQSRSPLGGPNVRDRPGVLAGYRHHVEERAQLATAATAGGVSRLRPTNFAPADGRVVRTRGWWRDHWSRNSWPALLYLFVEGSARELLGPAGLLGNHVVLDLGNGTFAALAHLKRGSITVTKGQVVRAGQQLAECGNSGNSSEPHIHFQLMDTSRTAIAAGLPFCFDGCDMPKNGQPFVATVHTGDY